MTKPISTPLAVARQALDHTISVCRTYIADNDGFPETDRGGYILPQGWADLYLIRLRRVMDLEEQTITDLECTEREAFEAWAATEWANGQAIPDNAWKGWWARARTPVARQAPIMIKGALYTEQQLINAIAMATSDGFRPHDLPK